MAAQLDAKPNMKKRQKRRLEKKAFSDDEVSDGD